MSLTRLSLARGTHGESRHARRHSFAGVLIFKVQESQPQQCRLLRPDPLLFTYLLLAADPAQIRLLLEPGVAAIACGTVTRQGGLIAPALHDVDSKPPRNLGCEQPAPT